MFGEGPRQAGPGLPCAAAIAVVAVALRCWRISWGLSGNTRYLGFPDEVVSWLPYVRDFIPLSCSSFDQLTLNYPTLYGYLVGLTTSLLHTLGVITVADPGHPYLHPSPAALLVARGVSVAASLVTVGIVGLTAGRMFSRRAGFMAAAFMAVVPFEVLYTHIASPDILLTTWFAATMLFSYLVAVGSGPWLAVAAGFAAGAAAATKYTGLAAVVAVGAAIAERTLRDRSVRRGGTLLGLALAGFGVAAFLGCPPCVLHPDRMLSAIRTLAGVTTHYSALHNDILSPTVGWYARPYLYQLVASLPFVLGWPMYALALAGIALAVRRHTVADRILFAVAAPYFLVMAGSMLVYPRYLLPLLPALVILAAGAADSIRSRRMRTVVLAGVWLYSLAFAGSQVARFSFDQQREVARWVSEAAGGRASDEVRVGVPRMIMDYYRLTGPFAEKGLRLVELEDGHWFDAPPDFFVLPEWYEIAIERDMPGSPVSADLDKLRSGAAGYRQTARWSSWYLQREFYTALDPAFAADLWQGEIGFTVYDRLASVGP